MAHAPSTIKSLLRRGWLEGTSYGVKWALEHEYKISPEEKRKLWVSAKGKTLLEEIAIETGWVFDKDNYDLIRNRAEYRSIQAKGEEEMDVEKDSIDLGTFDHLWEAAGACEQAAILLYGEDAKIYFDGRPRSAAVLSDEVIRQISALKEVDRPTILTKLKEAGLLDFL
jgi:hypothetical protein